MKPEPVEAYPRPRTRADCIDGPRPCPYVGCRHNTYLHVTEEGTIRFSYPAGMGPEDVPPQQSCALDLAERGGMTPEEVGKALGITRKRVRQVEFRIFRKLEDEADEDDFETPPEKPDPRPI